MRQILSEQKLNLNTLSLESSADHPDQRILPNGSRKESDKDLVEWLTELNVGKEVIEKVGIIFDFVAKCRKGFYNTDFVGRNRDQRFRSNPISRKSSAQFYFILMFRQFGYFKSF